MDNVNQIAWHNKRYTPEEVAKIQVALNKQALGHQLDVTGKIDQATIDAILLFLNLHAAELKVDGLAGDKTLSALGVTGIGDSSLTPTRKGQYLGRIKKQTSRAQAGADSYASSYYNSPEMLEYLLNPANARNDGEAGLTYTQHLYAALPYVSPEVAARLRHINNIGDEYDADVSAQHNAARNRKLGLLEMKNAAASGQLVTAALIDKWMLDHNLSAVEMLEGLADPNVILAERAYATRQDNGRVIRHDRVYGGEEAARLAENKAAVKYGLPGMLAVGTLGLASAATPLLELGVAPALTNAATSTMGTAGLMQIPASLAKSYIGGHVVNRGIDYLSKGKYNSWGDLMSGTTGVGDSWKWEMTNPGTLVGGFSRNYIPGNKGVKILVKNPRFGQSYSSPNAKVPVRTGTIVTEVSSGGGNTAFIPGSKKIVGGFNLATAPVYESVASPTVVKTYRKPMMNKTIGKTKDTTSPTFYGAWQTDYNRAQAVSRPILDVPSYDTSVTYGPYQGINRIQFKNGGKFNYLSYLN